MNRLLRTLSSFSLLTLLLVDAVYSQTPQWRLATGTAGLKVTALDIYRSNPDTMYAISDSGLLISSNKGELWNKVPGGRSISYSGSNSVRVDPFDSRRIYALHDDGYGKAFSMSMDGGATWNMIVPGSEIGGGSVITIDPTNHDVVYAATAYGLYRSTDRGESWLHLITPYSSIQSVAVDPVDGNHIWISYNLHYFKTVDAGATWTDIGFEWELIRHGRTNVFIHPDGAIYVTCWPGPSTPGGVFRSTDGGRNWEEMNNGIELEDRYASWLTADPSNPSELYLLSGSVFFSPDTGHTWIPLSDGLPRGFKQEISIDPVNRRIFTAVSTNPGDSNGVYILDLETRAPEEIATASTKFKLRQNYPNPFNSSTMIELHIPEQKYGRLEVFDILGRSVAIIAEGDFTAGTHRVSWDATNHPSGMYVCRFQGAHQAESTIMSFIR